MAKSVQMADGLERAPVPRPPGTIEETGLSADQVSQLFVKSLFTGEATGTVLAERLKLPYSVLEALVEHIRAEKLIEVKGSTGSGSASYRYALTDLGRDRARQFLDANSYVGAAPVPLSVYVETMRAVQEARGYITRDRLARGFTNLVISEDLLDQLGLRQCGSPQGGRYHLRPERRSVRFTCQVVFPEMAAVDRPAEQSIKSSQDRR